MASHHLPWIGIQPIHSRACLFVMFPKFSLVNKMPEPRCWNNVSILGRPSTSCQARDRENSWWKDANLCPKVVTRRLASIRFTAMVSALVVPTRMTSFFPLVMAV